MQFSGLNSINILPYVAVKLLSHLQLFETPCTAAHQAPLSSTISQSLLKFTWIESVMLQSIPASGSFPMGQLFTSGGQSIGTSASASVLPMSIQISFKIDWFALLAVQGTLKSLLQHHSSKASILQFSAFFMVQLSYPYMTTGKSRALTIWTFVGKVMSLRVVFNKLCLECKRI